MKKFLRYLSIFAMSFALLFAISFALLMVTKPVQADEYKAYIGETGYESLDAAINAAKATGTATTIKLAAGEHSLTVSTLPNDLSIIGEDDAKITNEPIFSAQNIYVENVDFIGSSYIAMRIHGYGTFKNCVIDGPNGTYYSTNYYEDKTLAFEDCTITGIVYGLHVGEGSGNVSATNCVITGWNSYGVTGSVTFTSCTINSSDSYGKLKFYQDATCTDCVFDSSLSIDSDDDITVTLTRCSTDDGTPVADLVEDYALDGSEFIIDGVDVEYYEAFVDENGNGSLDDSETAYRYFTDALAQGGKVVLLHDVTAEGKFSVSTDVTLDLAGYTLTLCASDNDVTGTNDVVIKNGTIELDPATSAGDGIIRIGAIGGNGGSLTLVNVDVYGENISSGAGTVVIYSNGEFTMDNSTLNITNENSSQAYMIYANDGTSGIVNITNDSEINGTNVNSGIFNGTVTISDSIVDMTTKDNGINSSENGMSVAVIKSTVEISGGAGRALTFYGAESKVEITNSTVTFYDNKEADIRFKTVEDGQIVINDTASVITFGTYVVDGDSDATLEDLLTSFDLPACGYIQNDEGTLSIAYNHENTTLTGAKDATCTTEGYTGDIVCDNCEAVLEYGTVIEKTQHNYEDGECTACGAADPDYVAPVEPTPTPTVTPSTSTTTQTSTNSTTTSGTAVKTGDSANIMLLMSVIALAGISVVVLGKKRFAK